MIIVSVNTFIGRIWLGFFFFWIDLFFLLKFYNFCVPFKCRKHDNLKSNKSMKNCLYITNISFFLLLSDELFQELYIIHVLTDL